MRAERFRELLTAQGPFASIYFDDSHDAADAAAQLDIKWRGVRHQLDSQGAAALAAIIEPAVLDSRPPVGRSGRGLIAGPVGVLLDEHLIRPPAAEVVRVSELPYVIPILEHAVEQHTYLLAAVDHTGADITVHRGRRVRTETVDGGGASGAETAGRGERAAEGGANKNIRAVAERLATLVDETGAEVVFVLGEVSSRADLLADLPERVSERVTELTAGARHSSVDDDEVRDAIANEWQLHRLAVIDDAAQRFTAESGRQSGLAAEGLAAVCAALREGAVETLILGDIGDATVVAGDELATIAPNENVLSEFGTSPTRTLRADEALAMVAIAVDANLVRTDERIDPADGVAAVLRYARSQY